MRAFFKRGISAIPLAFSLVFGSAHNSSASDTPSGENRVMLVFSLDAVSRPNDRRTVKLGLASYEIVIVPDGPGGGITGYEVHVHRIMNGRTLEKNLLEPRGTWHGLQPYMINPEDLLDGGPYGRTRKICTRGVTFRITVVDGHTRPLLRDPSPEELGFVFDSLKVAVEISRRRKDDECQ